MALPKFTCLDCGKTFIAGDYMCQTGVKHRVETKSYYTADAPTVAEWRDGRPYINKAIARTYILNVPPEKMITENGEVRRIPGGTVEFVRGFYETDDPEIQFYLDRKEGLCNRQRWEEVYINDDERHQIKELELRAREQRVVERENELLASVKSSQ